ncbi:MAG: CDP-alcohol phosphatidyltransferase family protein [Anaerolineae bacterium]|nr:CDP-alcohol phosphatidyltransferase family protein [Anaerolineae bacterium]
MPFEKHHWANIITGLRLVFLPLFVIAAIFDQPGLFAALFVLHSGVDILDGQVARRLHIQSDFGRRLDTFVDIVVWIPGMVIFLYLIRHDLDTIFSDYPYLLIVPVITAALMNLTAYHYLGSFAAIHLYTAKLTAGLIIVLMLVTLVDGFKPLLGYLTAIIGVIYHLEAMTIYLLKKDQTDENVTSLWQVISPTGE